MKRKLKEGILLFISIIIIAVCLMGIVLYGFSASLVCPIILSILVIVLSKRLKNLYPLSALFGLMAIIEAYAPLLIITGCGMISTFMKSDEESDLKTYIKKNTVLSSIVLGIAGISLISFSSIVGYVCEYGFGPEMLGELTACVLLGVVIYICHKYHFIIKSNVTFIEMIKISLPVWLILGVVASLSIFSGMYTSELQPTAFIIIMILHYLLVGVFEEFLIRGLVLNVLLDKYKSTPKKIWKAVILSSFIFGAAHFMNLSTGASFLGVTCQVISATAMGVYLAAIYLRTNNIWYNALIHGAWDACVTISYIFVNNEFDYGEIISGYNPLMLLSVVLYGILALFLLRKKKMNGVIAKLNNKEYKEPERPKVLAAQHFFAGVVIFFFVMCIPTYFNMFKNINTSVEKMVKEFPTYYDYDAQYLFSKNYKEEDLTPDIKLYMASTYIDLNDKAKIDFYIYDTDLKDSYKKLFDEDLSDKDLIDFEYSRGYSCVHDEEKYTCIYKGGVEPNVKVYFGIKSYEADTNLVKVNMYYLIEDLDSNRVYGDSSMENLLYSGQGLDVVLKNKYDDDDPYNKKFFEEVSNYFEVPVYTLEFVPDVTTNNLVFKGMDYEINKLDIELKGSNSFKRIDYDNRVVFKFDEGNFVEVKKVSQAAFIEKVVNATTLCMGNNKYYYNSTENVFLYNKNENYYYVTVVNNDYSLHKNVMNILSSISF